MVECWLDILRGWVDFLYPVVFDYVCVNQVRMHRRSGELVARKCEGVWASTILNHYFFCLRKENLFCFEVLYAYNQNFFTQINWHPAIIPQRLYVC